MNRSPDLINFFEDINPYWQLLKKWADKTQRNFIEKNIRVLNMSCPTDMESTSIYLLSTDCIVLERVCEVDNNLNKFIRFDTSIE